MKPYHPANLTLVPFSGWRVIALAWVGKLLGIHFHIQGIPFGATYQRTADTSGETGARPIRVDREGQAYLPERKIVLKAKGA